MAFLVSISEHCYKLSYLLTELPQREQTTKQREKGVDWLPAADWLHIAASIDTITLDIKKYDNAVMYCTSAWEYESKRNQLLTLLITKLSIFNFIWGGLETVIKVISPNQLDNGLSKKLKRRNEIVDRAIFFLKNEYDPLPRLPLYDEVLSKLRLLLVRHPTYFELNRFFREDELTSISGLGLHIVRKIRNDFAHGSANLLMPEDWGDKGNKITPSEQIHLDVIEMSSRLLLLTIQMLLIAFYKSQNIFIEFLFDDDGLPVDEKFDVILRVLHLSDYKIRPRQMKLIS